MSSATTLLSEAAALLREELEELRQRVQELERTSAVPMFIPMRSFPEWYRARTGSAVQPITLEQLKRWRRERHRLGVDWDRQETKHSTVYIHVEKLLAWVDRLERAGKVRPRRP